MAAPVAQTGAGNVTSASQTSGTNIVVNKPANVADGDLLVTLVHSSLTGATWTAPSGWTQQGGGNASRSLYLYTKPVASAAAETATDYTWAFSGGTGRALVICARVTGADLSSPLDVAGSVQTTGTSSTVAAQITTTAADDLMFGCWFTVHSTATVSDITGPGAMTDVGEVTLSTTVSGCLLLTQEAVASAGATGTRTATQSPSASSGVGGFLIALKAGAQAFSGSVDTSGSGTLDNAGVPAIPGNTDFTGSGSLTESGTPALPGALGTSGSGTVAGTGVPAPTGSRAFTGSGTLAITPQKLYAYDDFNRSNGAPGTSSSGHAWTTTGTAHAISSNRLAQSTTTDSECFMSVNSVDHYVQCRIALQAGYMAVVARRTNSTNQYFAQWATNSNAVRLYKVVSGTYTLLGITGAGVIGAGQFLGISVQGTAIKALVDGNVVLSATDSALTTGTTVGLRNDSSNASAWDDFSVYTYAPVAITEAAVTPSGSGSLTSSATPAIPGSVALSGSGTLSLSGQRLTSFTGLGSSTPSNDTAQNDTGAINLGLEFSVSVDCTATGIRWWQASAGTTSSSSRTVGLYRTTDGTDSGATLLGSASAAPSGTGWQVVSFTDAIALTAGHVYRAVVYHPDGCYTADGGYFTSGPGASGLSNGPIAIPNNADAQSNDQGSYRYLGALSFTDNSFNGANYWSDVIVSTAAPEVGSVDLAGSGTLSGAGTSGTADVLGLTGSGSLTLEASPGGVDASELSGDGTATLSGSPGPTGALDLTGSGELAGEALQDDHDGALDLAGSGDLGLSPLVALADALDRTGSGSLGLDGSGGYDGAFGSVAPGSLSLSGHPGPSYGLGLFGESALALSGRPKPSEALTLAGAGGLDLSGATQSSGLLALAGAGALTFLGVPGISRSVALSGSGSLLVIKFRPIDIDAGLPMSIWKAANPMSLFEAGPVSVRSPRASSEQ